MRRLVVVVGAALIAGCPAERTPEDRPSTPGPKPEAPKTPTVETTRKPEKPTPLPPPELPDVSPAQRSAAANGLNTFTFELYATARKPHNVCLSPFSAGIALSLVHLGAKADTAKTLAGALHLPADDPHASVGSLLEQSSGGKAVEVFGEEVPPHELTVANSLWVKRGYPLNKTYVAAARGYYTSEVGEIDVANPAEAAATINDWTAGKTRDKIKDLVPPSTIQPLTRLVIVNAVYLKARWREPFPEENTKPAPFSTEAGREVEAPTMHTMANLAYVADASVQVLAMDYWPAKGAELSMILVLPQAGRTLASVEAELTAERFAEWIGAAKSQFVEVALPKFRIETSLSLRKPLEKLGLGVLFTDPDLSGISAEAGLHVDEVIQKTFIDVDEKGTEAAGATAVMLAGTGLAPEPAKFIANRPFLYGIIEKKTGAILFIGRVADPSA